MDGAELPAESGSDLVGVKRGLEYSLGYL